MYTETKVEDLSEGDTIRSPLGTNVRVTHVFLLEGGRASIGMSDGPVLWKQYGDTVEVYREEIQ